MKARDIIAVGLIAFQLNSCSREKQDEVDLVTFPLRGEVVNVDTVKLRITIAHEEIPDYMNAMTMAFRVKDPSLLRDIAPGDSVLATLAVSRTESWLATLEVGGKGVPPELLTGEGVRAARLFKTGDRLPDLPFLNQDGETVHLRELHGKVVAMTFIYTRCPLPDFCIRMSDNFSRIQAVLKRENDLNKCWTLVTFSFDPAFDTPAVMKSYGKNYGADFAQWIFLTDADTSGRNVVRLADGLDLTYGPDEGPLIAHNLRTVLLDQEGRIVEVIKSNEWTPEEVAGKIKEMCPRVWGFKND